MKKLWKEKVLAGWEKRELREDLPARGGKGGIERGHGEKKGKGLC